MIKNIEVSPSNFKILVKIPKVSLSEVQLIISIDCGLPKSYLHNLEKTPPTLRTQLH